MQFLQFIILLQMWHRLSCTHRLSGHQKMVDKMCWRQWNCQLYQCAYERLSQMQHMHRKEWRLQSHAMFQLSSRFLLDVFGRLENTRLRILWMFALQRISEYCSWIGPCPSERSVEKVFALLWTLGEPFQIVAIGAGNIGHSKIPYQYESDEGIGNVDWLAAFV